MEVMLDVGLLVVGVEDEDKDDDGEWGVQVCGCWRRGLRGEWGGGTGDGVGEVGYHKALFSRRARRSKSHRYVFGQLAFNGPCGLRWEARDVQYVHRGNFGIKSL